MSSNVPGCKRRFASPDKQTVRFAGLANCGGVRRGSERSDRPSRTEPEPPKAAKRLQSRYMPFAFFYYIFIYIIICSLQLIFYYFLLCFLVSFYIHHAIFHFLCFCTHL